MFKKIGSAIKRPDWCRLDERYCRLDCLDRLLDGTFYDHLTHSYYDEQYQNGRTIPIDQRRPCAKYELPRMVARWAARKLFSGRHVPKVRHPEDSARQAVEALIVKSRLYWFMSEAVMRGSVGAIAMTFRVDRTENADEPDVGIKLWPAKYCVPAFDAMGELASLRVQYVTSGAKFLKMGATRATGAPEGQGIVPERQYWFIRDFLPDAELTYVPVDPDVWNPVQGFLRPDLRLEVWPEESVAHGLGFVPGHWFVNLTGGCEPDGACTWEDAIGTKIEIDYLLSQTARGARYNCAPQVILIGQPVADSGEIVRGPTYYIQMPSGSKDADGSSYNAGDAKLLEMTGKGLEAALLMIDKLRMLGLEQISAARKDPEKAKTQLSGRAMEYLDEDAHDLVMELRSAYGEQGMLPILRKMVAATGVADEKPITLQWPRLYQPTSDDVQRLVAAMAQAINPLAAQYAPAMPEGPSTPGADGKPAKPGTPATPEVLPPEEYQLITMEQAKLLLQSNLDLTMLEIEGEEVEQIASADVRIGAEATEMAPKAEEPAV